MRLLSRVLLPTAAAVLLSAGVAPAKTSHDGWPKIDGVFFRNTTDQDVVRHGTDRSDELLGGHGDDTLYGDAAADVIWGDHKPSGQTSRQHDRLYGGAGNDFIYASHGYNRIEAGAGNDYVKAHFGRGIVDCGPGRDVLYVSHKAQRHYKIRGCERISHKSLGF